MEQNHPPADTGLLAPMPLNHLRGYRCVLGGAPPRNHGMAWCSAHGEAMGPTRAPHEQGGQNKRSVHGLQMIREKRARLRSAWR